MRQRIQVLGLGMAGVLGLGVHLLARRQINVPAIPEPLRALLNETGVPVDVSGQERADRNVRYRQHVSQGLQPGGARAHVHVHPPAFAA